MSPLAEDRVSMPTSPLPLADRYEYVAGLKPSRLARGWVALDGAESKLVRVSVLARSELERVEPAFGVRQVNLAALVGKAEASPAQLPEGVTVGASDGLLLSEYVAGRTLHRLVKEKGPLASFKAAAWALRLADALKALHGRGVPHGALSARSIVAEPSARIIAPVLCVGTVPAFAAYASPERLRGGGPSASDDLWALCVLLYFAVTGELPFGEGPVSQVLAAIQRGRLRRLSDLSVPDEELQRLLEAGLDPEPKRRLTSLDELSRAIERWEREEKPAVPARAAVPRAVPRLGTLTMGSGAAANTGLLDGTDPVTDVEGEPISVPPPARPRHSAERLSRPLPSAPKLPPEPALDLEDPVFPPPAPTPSLEAGAPTRGVREAAGVGPRRETAPSQSVTPELGRRSRWPWLALVALAAVAGGYALWRSRSEDVVIPPSMSAPAASTAAAAVADSSASQPAKLSPAEELSRCVRAYFDRPAFSAEADLAFVCADHDFRDAATRLFAAPSSPGAVGSRGTGAATDTGTAVATDTSTGTAAGVASGAPASSAGATSTVTATDTSAAAGLVVKGTAVPRGDYDLGWYELPAGAIIRQECCPRSAPVVLPTTKGWCQQLQTVVRQVAENSQRSGDLSPSIKMFEEAVTCLYGTGVQRPYVYPQLPHPLQKQSFDSFLQRAAEVGARRTAEARRGKL